MADTPGAAVGQGAAAPAASPGPAAAVGSSGAAVGSSGGEGSQGSEQGFSQDNFGNPQGFPGQQFSWAQAFEQGAKGAADPAQAAGTGEQAGGAQGAGDQGAGAQTYTLPEGVTPEMIERAKKYDSAYELMEKAGFGDGQAIVTRFTEQEQAQVVQTEVNQALQSVHARLVNDLQAQVDDGKISPELAEEVYRDRMTLAEQRARGEVQQRQTQRQAAVQQQRGEIRGMAEQFPSLKGAGDVGVNMVLNHAATTGVSLAVATAQVAGILQQQREMAVSDYLKMNPQAGGAPAGTGAPVPMGAGGAASGASQAPKVNMRSSWQALTAWMKRD